MNPFVLSFFTASFLRHTLNISQILFRSSVSRFKDSVDL